MEQPHPGRGGGRGRGEQAARRNNEFFNNIQRPAEEAVRDYERLRQRLELLRQQGGLVGNHANAAEDVLGLLDELIPGLQDQASLEVARRVNQQQPPVIFPLDLHAQRPPQGVRLVAAQLQTWQGYETVGPPVVLQFITGQGRHSPDGSTPLRDAVTSFLTEQGIAYVVPGENPGVVLVHTEDIPAGWQAPAGVAAPTSPSVPGECMLHSLMCRQ